jgi:hypothetical protein
LAQELEPVPVQFKVGESVDTILHNQVERVRGQPL